MKSGAAARPFTFLIKKFHKQYEKRTEKQTGFVVYRLERPEEFKEAVKEKPQ